MLSLRHYDEIISIQDKILSGPILSMSYRLSQTGFYSQTEEYGAEAKALSHASIREELSEPCEKFEAGGCIVLEYTFFITL